MKCRFGLLICLTVYTSDVSHGRNYYLTIGGGPRPSANQASLEKNVLYAQRVLNSHGDQTTSTTLFADGTSNVRDLQVKDLNAVPRANQLMAEFFGSTRDLGLTYRDHRVSTVTDAATPKNVAAWFDTTSPHMKDGDRLLIYVTAHGRGSSDRRQEYNTSISMWGDTSLTVSEFVGHLDKLPVGIEVIVVMVQCHAGGFARFLFNEADPDKGLSPQKRSGFFATVHDRQAAGCTPEVDEAGYVEYSTYFWAAMSGQDRLGKPIESPDYDKDGRVSFAEAHAYTVLTADTIDLPIKTSGEYLRIHSRFGDSADAELLPSDLPYPDVLELANPVQAAVLEGLSERLSLTSDDRLEEAYRKSRSARSRNRTSRNRSDPGSQLRRKIAAALKRRWPELANIMNPVAIDLVTTRAETFIAAVEEHPDYERYRRLVDQSEARPDEQKRRVKYERLLRFADNVILAENLSRMADPESLIAFEAICAAENQSLVIPD